MIDNARVRGLELFWGWLTPGTVLGVWEMIGGQTNGYNGGCLNATADLMVGDTVDTVETVQDTHGFHEVLMTVLW